jgi:hypothetical protein
MHSKLCGLIISHNYVKYLDNTVYAKHRKKKDGTHYVKSLSDVSILQISDNEYNFIITKNGYYEFDLLIEFADSTLLRELIMDCYHAGCNLILKDENLKMEILSQQLRN